MPVTTDTTESAEVVQHQPLLRTHMPELDTIRGIAIISVIAYHAFYWARDLNSFGIWQRRFLMLLSPGQFGVNLFFVLSGFLITGILIDSRNRKDYYARFYFRRALRILPAYYFTLLLLVVFGLTSRGFLFMSLVYCSNLSGLFGIALSYAVLWSLAVEEHFYLLWPTAVRNLDERKLLWIVSSILLFCPLSRYLYHMHAVRTGVSSTFGYYTWNNADGLALGALMALLLRKPGWERKQLGRVCITLLGLGVLIAAAGYPAILTRQSPIGEALQTVPWNLGGGALLGTFLLLGSSARKSLVRPRPIIFFGKISYGLYLYHLMFFGAYKWLVLHSRLGAWNALGSWQHMWIRAFFAGGTAVLFSYASRHYFEEPFLQLKEMYPRRKRQPMVACTHRDTPLTPKR